MKRVIFCFILVWAFSALTSAVKASPINVLQFWHKEFYADNDITVTQAPTCQQVDPSGCDDISGYDLTSYDVIYMTEHIGNTGVHQFDPIANRYDEIHDLLISGDIGLILSAQFINNNAQRVYNIILEGKAVSDGGMASGNPPMTLTSTGEQHPIFTGIGIPGGEEVSVSGLANGWNQQRYKIVPNDWDILATDTSGMASFITGNIGAGKVFLLGAEPMEGASSGQPITDDEKMFVHNAVHWASPQAAPVPEPSTMVLLCTGLIGLIGVSRKKWLMNVKNN